MKDNDSLVQLARSGDQRAQGKLVQLWYKRIYNFSFKYFLDHDMAMEVSQKTFIAMCRGLNALSDVSRFSPWLYKIALNHCREETRKIKISRLLRLDFSPGDGQEGFQEWEKIASVESQPDEKIYQEELSELIQMALRKIPTAQREVILLKEYEGLKFREIAEVLNLSENTVKSRMYYGLQAMKNILVKSEENGK